MEQKIAIFTKKQRFCTKFWFKFSKIVNFSWTAPLETFETADCGEVTSSSTFDDFASNSDDFDSDFESEFGFKADFGFIAEDNSTFRALLLRAVEGGRGGRTLRGIVIVSGIYFSQIFAIFEEKFTILKKFWRFGDEFWKNRAPKTVAQNLKSGSENLKP